MTHRFGVARVARLCLLACVAAALASLWTSPAGVRALDRNGDGRPDVWQSYGADGSIAERTLDTNFDGRSDVREYYEHGALVRRESDRDFNDRIDLVQRFNAETRQHESSIVDVDADGSADLLVLFRNGRPVFTKWAPVTRRARAAADAIGHQNVHSDGRGWTLANPFASDPALQAQSLPSDDHQVVGLSTAGGLPLPAVALSQPLVARAGLLDCGATIPAPASAALPSPRGPPSTSSVHA